METLFYHLPTIQYARVKTEITRNFKKRTVSHRNPTNAKIKFLVILRWVTNSQLAEMTMTFRIYYPEDQAVMQMR